MKTLSVQQPWASIICTGVKDVENRSWKPKDVPGRILIHAGAKRVPKDFDDTNPNLEVVSALANMKMFGILPQYNELPTSAIIGYVDVVGFDKDNNSLWAGAESIHWQLENAYLFDEPIEGVKGKLGLFDYPLDEDNLPPAHKVELNYPTLEGEHMTVHLSDESWEMLMKDDSVMSVDAEQGVIRFSATDLSMFDFSTAAAPFVQIIFDVRELSPEDSEITKVDLSVNDLLVSEPNPVSGESLPERETVLVANGKVLKNNLTKAVQVSKYTTITPSNFVEPKPATPDEALTTIVPVSQQPTTFVKPTAAADKKKTTEAEEGQPLLYTGTWLVALCILLLLMICSTVLLILRKRDIYNN